MTAVETEVALGTTGEGHGAGAGLGALPGIPLRGSQTVAPGVERETGRETSQARDTLGSPTEDLAQDQEPN